MSQSIEHLAKTRAARMALVQSLEDLGSPQDYQMAVSAYEVAETEYQRAISLFTTQELMDLSVATRGEIQP